MCACRGWAGCGVRGCCGGVAVARARDRRVWAVVVAAPRGGQLLTVESPLGCCDALRRVSIWLLAAAARATRTGRRPSPRTSTSACLPRYGLGHQWRPRVWLVQWWQP